MGLGGYPGLSLARAREVAQSQREIVLAGDDPLVLRQKQRASATIISFGDAADHLVETLKSDWTNEKHRQQWRRTVSYYCEPIRHVPVKDIDTDDVLRVLKPIWRAKAETARRLRSRLERVLDY